MQNPARGVEQSNDFAPSHGSQPLRISCFLCRLDLQQEFTLIIIRAIATPHELERANNSIAVQAARKIQDLDLPFSRRDHADIDDVWRLRTRAGRDVEKFS